MPFNVDAYLDRIYERCVRSKDDLHDYQREALAWLRKRPFSALFVDVGMGKTIIIETLLDEYFTKGFNGKVLIIAPIRVAARVWMREHQLWFHTAYFRPIFLRVDDDDPRLRGFSGIRKTAKKLLLRKELLDNESRIHIINQEAVPWLVDQWYERGRWPYQIVIYDESSRLRDHKSESVKALRRVRSKIKRLHELTATPASQSYMYFFSQIYLLDEGKRLGTNITAYRKRYFDENKFTHVYTLKDGADVEIERKISDVALVMRRKREFKIVTRNIELPKNIMAKYRQFEIDSVMELGDTTIDAVNAAVLSNKLLQFASGAVYDADQHVHRIHDDKIEELRQLDSETDTPIMVAYWYKSSLARLREAFPHAGVMDREGKLEAAWNRRELKMMFVHPRSSAHGLNLQYGGHHVALFDIFWPLELFLQLIGRLDRQGQTDTVVVHLLSCVGTHDEVVADNLSHLRQAEDAMFRRLRNLQRKSRDG